MMPIEMTERSNPNAQQDESAVAAVRGGDAERYRELVERHERRVYAVAWSRLGDAALAEEVTQEAFIRAYRRLWLLGDGAKFSGWVNTIARRVAINFGLRHRRELNKRERWALETFDNSAAENSASEADPLHTPETLRQTLAELPAAHRECLVLFYLEGKSGAEAAAALGISETALRVRLHRARAAMRERLEEKLEHSLIKLGPAKSLVPAVMAGVLATSSAKAAMAGGIGATLWGALIKLAPIKWALSIFPLLLFLPFVLLQWVFMRAELNNFRDATGFRARLFRQNSRWLILWVALITGLIWYLMPRIHWGNGKTFDLAVGGIGLVLLPFQIRCLNINRSRYLIANLVSSAGLFLAFLLAGLGWLPQGWLMLLIMLQSLVMMRYLTQQPRRMDYNLFLRGTEGLLKTDAAAMREAPEPSKSDLLAFARFLGTRWLANNYRWTTTGLELGLLPANTTVGSALRNFSSWSQRSSVLLQANGIVSAHLGRRDQKVLRQLHGEKLPSDPELETLVARAVELAWREFRAGNVATAERAIGQVPEEEFFFQPRPQLVSNQVQRAIWIGCILFAVGTLILTSYSTGSFPSLSLQGLSDRNYQRAMNDLKHATKEKRIYVLGGAAKESFVAGKMDDARRYAEELMALIAEKQADGKGGENLGMEVHDANVVLGRIALREGRTDVAKKHLIAAGKSPGSPTLDSFGPNMTLAQDLLEKGERDTVLEYFMRCRKFWKLDHDKLAEWMQEVLNGKTPDFGANLFY